MSELPRINASADRLNEVFELLGLFLKASSQETVFRVYTVNGTARIQALTSHLFDAYIGEADSDIDISLLYSSFRLPPKEDATLIVVPDAISIQTQTMTVVLTKANTVLTGIEVTDLTFKPVTNQKQLLSAINTLDRLTEFKNSFRSNATIEIGGGLCRSRYPIAWVEVNVGSVNFEHTFDISMARFLKLFLGSAGLQIAESEAAIYFERDGNILMCARRYPTPNYIDDMVQDLQCVGQLKAEDMVEALKLFDKEALVTVSFNTDNTVQVSSVMETASLKKTLSFHSCHSEFCVYSGPANFFLNIFYSLRGEVDVYICHNRATPLLQVASTEVKCLISSAS